MANHYFQIGCKNGKEFLGKSLDEQEIIEIIKEGKQRFIHLDNAHRVAYGIDQMGISRKINTPVDSDGGIDILIESIETVFKCDEETAKNAEGEGTPKIEVPPPGLRMPDFKGNAKGKR